MLCMRTNAGGEGFRQSFVYSRLFSNGGVTDARGMKERKKKKTTKNEVCQWSSARTQEETSAEYGGRER